MTLFPYTTLFRSDHPKQNDSGTAGANTDHAIRHMEREMRAKLHGRIERAKGNRGGGAMAVADHATERSRLKA